MVRASDLLPRGRRFEFVPLGSTCNPGQVVHILVPLFTKQYKLVPAQAGSVRVRAIETEIIAALWALVAREGL